MRIPAFVALICLTVPTAIALGDTEPASPAAATAAPLIAHGTHVYAGSQKVLRLAAEAMPEEAYGFRPVDTVRTFGQIIGHLADGQTLFCSRVLGVEDDSPDVEETTSGKAELLAALDAAFAVCDRAYAAMDDAVAVETIRIMGSDTPKLGVLNVNNLHVIAHYGNLVTYLRMNGIVPPTSDPELMRQLRD